MAGVVPADNVREVVLLAREVAAGAVDDVVVLVGRIELGLDAAVVDTGRQALAIEVVLVGRVGVALDVGEEVLLTDQAVVRQNALIARGVVVFVGVVGLSADAGEGVAEQAVRTVIVGLVAGIGLAGDAGVEVLRARQLVVVVVVVGHRRIGLPRDAHQEAVGAGHLVDRRAVGLVVGVGDLQHRLAHVGELDLLHVGIAVERAEGGGHVTRLVLHDELVGRGVGVLRHGKCRRIAGDLPDRDGECVVVGDGDRGRQIGAVGVEIGRDIGGRVADGAVRGHAAHGERQRDARRTVGRHPVGQQLLQRHRVGAIAQRRGRLGLPAPVEIRRRLQDARKGATDRLGDDDLGDVTRHDLVGVLRGQAPSRDSPAAGGRGIRRRARVGAVVRTGPAEGQRCLAGDRDRRRRRQWNVALLGHAGAVLVVECGEDGAAQGARDRRSGRLVQRRAAGIGEGQHLDRRGPVLVQVDLEEVGREIVRIDVRAARDGHVEDRELDVARGGRGCRRVELVNLLTALEIGEDELVPADVALRDRAGDRQARDAEGAQDVRTGRHRPRPWRAGKGVGLPDVAASRQGHVLERTVAVGVLAGIDADLHAEIGAQERLAVAPDHVEIECARRIGDQVVGLARLRREERATGRRRIVGRDLRRAIDVEVDVADIVRG